MKHHRDPLSDGVYRDVLSRFLQGASVKQVKARRPSASYAMLADAYFAVQAEINSEYTNRLAGALTSAAATTGLARAVLIRRALETLAAHGILTAVVRGRIPAVRKRERRLQPDEVAASKIIEARP